MTVYSRGLCGVLTCSICQRREGTGKPTASPTEPQIEEKTRRELMAGTQNKVKGKIFDAFSKPQQKA